MVLSKLFDRRSSWVWYYDIPSNDEFLEFSKAKKFEQEELEKYIDKLVDEEDSVTINTQPGRGDCVSVWGKEKGVCTIECENGSKGGSFCKDVNKDVLKSWLANIDEIHRDPIAFGITNFKEW